MLLQLAALPQVPGADRVVQPSGPQLRAVVGDVDAAGAVRVALELPAKKADGGLRESRPQRAQSYASARLQASAPSGLGAPSAHLTSVWLCRSHTAMLPSLQHEKQTLASGLMARA